MSKTKATKKTAKQRMLWDENEKAPATELMKTVAAKTLNKKNMEKVFTPDEIEEILARRDVGESLTPAEHKTIRMKYRRMKRQAKEMEVGNKSKLIAVPSITNDKGFYKLFDFSALYYVYRLANRMGRSAKLMSDSDKFVKVQYVASIVDIEKFKEQFQQLESSEIEITEDGIYIFTLKRELSDEEVSELRMVEQTRRDSLHNILRPKKMDPAVFQAILTVIRQVGPRAKKLERHEYYAIGEKMLIDMNSLLRTYYDYTRGIIDKNKAGNELMTLVDDLFAGLTILSELRIWDFSAATVIGDNVNEIRRLVAKDFDMKEA